MNIRRTVFPGLIAAIALGFSPVTNAQSAEDISTFQAFLDIMGGYFDVINATHDISSNSEKSAILQLQKIQEIYEEAGDQKRAITVFKEILEQTDNQTVRNAVYMLLGDALKEAGRHDEAVSLLRVALDENIQAAGSQ